MHKGILWHMLRDWISFNWGWMPVYVLIEHVKLNVLSMLVGLEWIFMCSLIIYINQWNIIYACCWDVSRWNKGHMHKVMKSVNFQDTTTIATCYLVKNRSLEYIKTLWKTKLHLLCICLIIFYRLKIIKTYFFESKIFVYFHASFKTEIL